MIADFGNIQHFKDVALGPDSPDTSISSICKEMLEGYSEIPAPEQYSFSPENLQSPFDVKAAQNWISECAVEMRK